jgi:uncharacterized membrane protein YgaE (UPF0421/DUF939 family)
MKAPSGPRAWRPFSLYILRCLAGVSIGYGLYVSFPRRQFVWAMISTLLVISPESEDSFRLAVSRMEANVIGSSVGLLVFFLLPPGLAAICSGVALTILACRALGVLSAARSALAALIIVSIHESEARSWHAAIERMGCVMVGCVIAMGVSLLFGRFFLRDRCRPDASE